MNRLAVRVSLAVLLTVLLATAVARAASAAGPSADTLYREHCATCHGAKRFGGYAPPLIPDTLQRTPQERLAQIIRDGLPQTQMPGFADKLRAEEVRAIAALLGEPAGEIDWRSEDIAASRVELPPDSLRRPEEPYRAPQHREQIVLVVERGTGSIAVLDGENLEQRDKFYVGRIHGGPKFDDAYTSTYAVTRDGTVARYDLLRGRVAVKAKVAVNTRNIAVSPDGMWVAAANQLPQNLVLMDGDLRPRAILPLEGKPSGVYWLPGSNQFVATLRDVPRMILVSTPDLAVQRVELAVPFEDFTFIPGRPQMIASARGGTEILLYDIAARQVRGRLATRGLPHLFSATFFMRDGVLLAALNHIGLPKLSIIDLDKFQVLKELTLAGAGFFVRTHPHSPYLWVDTNTEALQLVDKATLTLLPQSLVPEPGKNAMHVEFTADGSKALLSLWHPEGAVVVYDAVTAQELRRLPFNMPIGKYNALNKTHFPLQ